MPDVGRIVLVPGFMGSRLARAADGRLIWVDALWTLLHLRDFFHELSLTTPTDLRLRPDGVLDDVPFGGLFYFGVYSPLRRFAMAPYGLGMAPPDFIEYGYDWRKGLDVAASGLGALLDGLPNDARPRPLSPIPKVASWSRVFSLRAARAQPGSEGSSRSGAPSAAC